MKKNFFYFLCLSGFLLWLQACDIKQPKVEASYASVSFKHTGTETTCLTCHTDQRPAAVNSFSHYDNADCKYCHTAGGKWTDHNFHSNNGTPTKCSNCHEKDRKAAVAGVPHGSGGDCVSCHSVGSNWATGASPHNPTPTSCTSCHASNRPAPVNGYAHYNGDDCVTCHVPGGVWANYKLYSHTPVSATCNQCHSNDRPALSKHPSQNDPAVTDKRHYVAKDCTICHKPPTTTRVFSFVHTNSTGGKINFCLPCHYTKGWDKHGSTHSSYFTGDGTCYSCHNRGKTWSN